MMKRYHLTLGQKRTTVSLGPVISNLLALRLGCTPQSPKAHGTVRSWLQQRLDENNDPGRIRVSQWLQDQIVLFLVDTNLSERYGDWLLEEWNT